MTTYTVINPEDDDGIEDMSGLSLEQAVARFMEMSHYDYEIRRVDGVMTLLAAYRDEDGEGGPLAPIGVSSTLPDDAAARREIFEAFLDLDRRPILNGAIDIMSDEDYVSGRIEQAVQAVEWGD